jgi:hypothetical protein
LPQPGGKISKAIIALGDLRHNARMPLNGCLFTMWLTEDDDLDKPPGRAPDPHRREVRERALTQVVPVRSEESVPAGYFCIRATSSAIYGKVQVLSHRHGKPVFVESPAGESAQRIAYWAHESVLPELKRWLALRTFEEYEIRDKA